MKTKTIVFCAILLLLTAISTLTADTSDTKTNKSETTEKDALKNEKLAAITKEIDQIEAKLALLKKSEKSLLNDIYQIELSYEKARIENNKLKMQLRSTTEAISQKSTEQKLLTAEIDKSKKNLKKILRILYKLGDNSYLKLFIRVASFEQLFKNYRMFTALINYKSTELEKLKNNIQRLNVVNNELKLSYAELQSLQQEQEKKLRSIAGLKQGKLTLIRKINTDRKNYLQLRDEMRAEAAHIDQLISGESSLFPSRTLDLDGIRGKLRWPLNGKIISSYGKVRSTRFNTYIFNNGIKIQPGGSDNVRAVYSGVVVFADYFKGYGNLIIVQHSKKFYSLYGYNDKILKAKGDSVEEGELISVAGDTGSTTGKALYFEIRNESEAQDPVKWLRRRRG